ncbi:MAG: alpha/beta hydrolase [Bacteroidales bacterium]|nr:alpha/beta hydrolase [Bacteroidales bacterium]
MKPAFYFKATVIILIFFGSLYSCRNGSGKKSGEAGGEAQSEAVRGTGADNFTVPGHEEGTIDMSLFPTAVLNVHYVADDNQSHLLDIIYPFYGRPPFKTIVLFHGGGWTSGDKQSASLAPLLQATTQGYAVVSVNYRLAGEVAWPGPLHDAKAAIRFLRANSDKYRIDTEKIVVWGLSSGAHLATMLAATNDSPGFEDLSMGNPGMSSSVQGVVSWYGVSDITTLSDEGTKVVNRFMGFDVRSGDNRSSEASPAGLITKKFPPILLVHGSDDQIIPYGQSVEMQKKINETTGSDIAELKIIEGAGHDDPDIKTTENMADNLNFVDRILYDGSNPHRGTNYITFRFIK